MSLDKYLKSFSRLRTYKDRKKWSALTTHQAPHKPFLLLTIMDLIAQGSITQNFIEPSVELFDTFNTYWTVSCRLVQKRPVIGGVRAPNRAFPSF